MASSSVRARSEVFVGAPNSVGHEAVVGSVPPGLRATGQMPGYTGHVPGLGTESYGRAYSASTRRLYAPGGEPQHAFRPAGKSGALAWEFPADGVPEGYTGHVPGATTFGLHGKTTTSMLSEATARRRAGEGASKHAVGVSFLPLSEIPRRVGGNTAPVPLADMLDKVGDGAASSRDVAFDREVTVAVHAISDRILSRQTNRLHRTLETELHVQAVRRAQAHAHAQAQQGARAPVVPAGPTRRRDAQTSRVDRGTFAAVLRDFHVLPAPRVAEAIFLTVAAAGRASGAPTPAIDAAIDEIDIDSFSRWIDGQDISRHGSTVVHPPEDYVDFRGHWGPAFIPRHTQGPADA